jgi:hypothetical protein
VAAWSGVTKKPTTKATINTTWFFHLEFNIISPLFPVSKFGKTAPGLGKN